MINHKSPITNHKSYDTKRPPEKEMIFGIRAVIEAIDAGKTLNKVLIRRDMSSAIGRELLDKLRDTPTTVQRVPVEKLNQFTYRLGEHLMKLNPEGESILAESVKNGVKIFIPALCDSSIGIALVSARRACADISIDQLADADILTRIVENSERTGVVYVGGGVPKNFIQQTQVIASIHDAGKEGHNYAVQFTVDSPQWGGLSGCTFEEAVSWGKEATDCRKVQCFCDATIAVPIVVSGLIARGVVRKSPPDIDRLMK